MLLILRFKKLYNNISMLFKNKIVSTIHPYNSSTKRNQRRNIKKMLTSPLKMIEPYYIYYQSTSSKNIMVLK